MFFTQTLYNHAKKILKLAKDKNYKIAAAESCTGGLLTGLFTEVVGASDIVDRGFITYSNESKHEMLGVKEETLRKFGAVSPEVAQEMAKGAVKKSSANLSLAITGIAGPTGATQDKPVGLVFIASYNAKREQMITRKFNFSGDRREVRKASLVAALDILESQIV